MKTKYSKSDSRTLVWACLAAGAVVLMWPGPSAIRVVSEGDLGAYFDIRPSTETLQFRRDTVSSDHIEMENGKVLTGWRARNFLHHVRVAAKADFCTCENRPFFTIFDANDRKLATVRYRPIETNDMLVETPNGTKYFYLVPSSMRYLSKLALK